MTETRTFTFDPKAALIAYHAAIQAQDFPAIAAMFHADIAYESPGVGTVNGRDAVIESFRAYFAEYPTSRPWTTRWNASPRWPPMRSGG